jgi:hypothetical protein
MRRSPSGYPCSLQSQLKKVYTAKEIAQMLELSLREAYNLLSIEGEKGSFLVVRFGSRPSIRADM